MLEIGLEFEWIPIGVIVEGLLSLPEYLRPEKYCSDENSPGKSVSNRKALEEFLIKSQSGFFLKRDGLVFSLRIVRGKKIYCDCFSDLHPGSAKELLVRMATIGPNFGYACDPAERERRNRINIVQGMNIIETWVGRNTDKSIPGLYWLTLISEKLFNQFGVSSTSLLDLSLGVGTINNGSHFLIQLYDSPEMWKQYDQQTVKATRLLPGVFNIEDVEKRISGAKGFNELNELLAAWR